MVGTIFAERFASFVSVRGEDHKLRIIGHLTEIGKRSSLLSAYPVHELLRPLLFLQGWQFAEKACRVLVVVILARSLGAVDLGIVGVAFAIGEIVKALTQNGTAQKVVAASDLNLGQVSRSVYRFQMYWVGAVVILQVVCAIFIWRELERPMVALIVALLAIEYFALPRISVSLGLALRDGRTREQVAHVAGGQNVVGHVATLLFLIIWPHPMSFVLGRLVAVPVFYFGILAIAPWKPIEGPSAPTGDTARFACAVTMSEIAKAARMHLDKVVIGSVLGMAAAGEYFFAFSAGLGLANGLSVAIGTALFPFLSGAQDRTHALFYAIRLTSYCIVPIVVAQALLAPLYVPLLFSEKWAHLSHVVSILCVAAIPGTLWAAVAQYLRSIDRAGIETVVTIAQTVVTSITLLWLAPSGLAALAWGFLLSTTAVTLIVSIPLLWQIKKQQGAIA